MNEELGLAFALGGGAGVAAVSGFLALKGTLLGALLLWGVAVACYQAKVRQRRRIAALLDEVEPK